MDIINKIIEALRELTDEVLAATSDPVALTTTTKTVLVFSATLVVSFVYLKCSGQQYSVKPCWPPGPKPWPIIGNTFEMRGKDKSRLYDNISNLCKQYGDVMHLYGGLGIDIVVLSSDAIREAYVDNGDVFSDRPLHIAMVKRMSHYHKGIIMNHGPVYKAVRRFTMRTLKDFGVGTLSLENSIKEEARQIISILLKSEGEPVDPKYTINNGVSNIICSLIFGNRYDHDDKRFRELLYSLEKLFVNSGSQNMVKLFIPIFLQKIFSNRMRIVKKAQLNIDAYIFMEIEKHRIDFDINNLRDFTDYYLKSEVEKEGIEMDDMFRLIFDLFMAGSETTTTTLGWMIIYLLRNPDVQKRCRQEIHSVIGTGRLPCWKDRTSLPFLEATLLETQRHANLVPLGVTHCTSRPINFRGYLIPEKTLIMTNMTSCLFDDKDFIDPYAFRPQRWLTSDESALLKEKPKNYLPFGVGPRVCAGENLAKMEMFLFATCFIQQMNFDLETEGVLPSDVGVQGGTLVPAPFKVRFTSCL